MPERLSTATADAQLGRIARSGSLNLLGAAIASIGGFVLVVVVTDRFSQPVAGMLFSATSVFLVLLGAATLGTEGGMARFLLRYEATGRDADIPECVRVARRPVLAASCVLALGTAVLSPWLAPLIGLNHPSGPLILVLLALLLPVAALGDFSLGAARGFGSVRSTVLLDKLLRPSLQPVAALLVALTGGGIVGLTVGWAVPYALAGLLSAWILQRMLRRRGAGAPPVTDRAELRREFWSFTWPRGLARLSQILLQRADIVLVASLLSVRDAAIYTAATRFVALGQLGGNAIQQVLQPRFSQMLARNQQAEAGHIFKISTAWNMAVAWPIYLVTAGASGLYLLMFGARYNGAEAASVVVIMSVAMLLAVAAGPLDTLLLMAGGSRTSLWISLSALGIDVLGCLLLLPVIGLPGAALAWALSVLVKNIATFICVRSSLAMNPLSRAAGIVAGAACLCFGAPALMLSLLHQKEPLLFAAVLSLGAAAYAGALWLGRRPLELKALRALRSGTRRPEPEGA
ncbi:oligosaccharide flippase family protein [Paenarthrobacter sp. DKR-5]|uniref:lipopolysaccharide biosynthesis protein n=1 Tax=Paenarthrobacter sp. DKR-5 TaxID=2835535 RepID=UPI001BDBC34B|nr:oligosaccharide flippase family protein [Paenarthrobacter sp. DKR-5]MBT1002471.1 oligosaccharide flippase family protein [Paenarthrobacter sp. DKR-5]